MKIETILNALGQAINRWTHVVEGNELDDDEDRLERMILAFRARILRMFAEKDEEIKGLEKDLDSIHEQLISWNR